MDSLNKSMQDPLKDNNSNSSSSKGFMACQHSNKVVSLNSQWDRMLLIMHPILRRNLVRLKLPLLSQMLWLLPMQTLLLVQQEGTTEHTQVSHHHHLLDMVYLLTLLYQVKQLLLEMLLVIKQQEARSFILNRYYP